MLKVSTDSPVPAADADPPTVSQSLIWSIPILAQAEVDTPRLDAQLILAWVLKSRREDLAREPDRCLNVRETVIFRKAIELRAQRRPLPYITGEAWFYGRPFKVNRAVLIPRPETEMLVDFALRVYKKREAGSEFQVADIGTGSGCIAISIACEIPTAYISATDISPLALLIATKNRRRYQVEERVELIEGDLLAPLRDYTYDLIVANPPYIPTSDAPSLMPEVRDYEPSLALYGSEGATPESLRQALLNQAMSRLNNGGQIAIELGIGQAEEAANDALKAGFENIEILEDIAGIGRIVTAYKMG